MPAPNLDELKELIARAQVPGSESKEVKSDALPSLRENIQTWDAHETLTGLSKLLDGPEEQVRASLKSFLDKRWRQVKGTYLSYTSTPNSKMTKICCSIAEFLSSKDKPALMFLMPTLKYTLNLAGMEDIREFPLAKVLSLHVCSDDQESLIPVSLLSYLDLESDLAKVLRNPFVEVEVKQEGQDQPRKEFQQLSVSEKQRLIHHSLITEEIISSRESFAQVVAQGQNLYSAVNNLIHGLRRGGAHGLGGGTEEKATVAAYQALGIFREFWKQLTPEQRDSARENKEFERAINKKICNVGYELAMMSDNLVPEKDKLYLRVKNNELVYTVITPGGETVSDLPLKDLPIPDPFTLEHLNQLKVSNQPNTLWKTKILGITTYADHTQPPWNDCVEILAKELDSCLTRCRDKFTSISLDGNQQAAILAVHQDKFKQTRQDLEKALEQSDLKNSYQGRDNLFLSLEQVESLINPASIHEPEDVLLIIKDLQPSEMERVVGRYKGEFTRAIHNADGLFTIVLNLGVQQVEPFTRQLADKVHNKAINVDSLSVGNALNFLSDGAVTAFLKGASFQLFEDLRPRFIGHLSEGKVNIVLDACADMTGTVNDVVRVLRFMPDLYKEIYWNKVGAKLGGMANNIDDIGHALKILPAPYQEKYWDKMGAKLGDMANSVDDIRCALKILPTSYHKKYWEKVEDKLGGVTGSIPDAAWVLHNLPDSFKGNYRERIEGRLAGMTGTISDARWVMNNMPDSYKDKYREKIEGKLADMTESISDAAWVLSGSSMPDSYKETYLVKIVGKLVELTKTANDVGYILQLLPVTYKEKYLTKLLGNLVDKTKIIDDIDQALKLWPDFYKEKYWEKIQSKLADMTGTIKEADWALKNMPGSYKEKYLMEIAGKAADITRGISDVGWVLEHLPVTAQKDYWAKLESKLVDITQAYGDVTWLLEKMPGSYQEKYLVKIVDKSGEITQKIYDIRHIPVPDSYKDKYLIKMTAKLADLTNTVHDVIVVMDGLPHSHKENYLMKIESKLGDMTTSVDDLIRVLEILPDTRKNKYWQNVEDKLPGLTRSLRDAVVVLGDMPDSYRENYWEKIAGKLVEMTKTVSDVTYVWARLPDSNKGKYLSKLEAKLIDLTTSVEKFNDIASLLPPENKKIYIEQISEGLREGKLQALKNSYDVMREIAQGKDLEFKGGELKEYKQERGGKGLSIHAEVKGITTVPGETKEREVKEQKQLRGGS